MFTPCACWGAQERFLREYTPTVQCRLRRCIPIVVKRRSMLVGHSDNRLMPTDEEIKKELYEDEDIQPYINPYSGTKLSASAAISLLNRYCSILPHDQFTRIIPKWIAEEKKTRKGEVMLLVTITLPIVCPVKEDIKGEPRKLLKAAKRTAALKACIELHKAGELDRESLLPREYAQVNFGTEEVKNCFPNWPWDEKEDSKLPKPGTKKRMRKHEKVYPSCLEGKKDWESDIQTFYLHVINMTIEFKEPKDSRELALYKLLMQTNGYAFLTYKPLPKICQFLYFIISYSIKYWTLPKKFVVYDGGINTLYVVPTIVQNGKHIVDWDTMTTHDSIPPHAPPLPQERRDLKVTRESYQYSVVTPWYRVDLLPSRYIVSNILEYLTPNSPFDDDTYSSYQHYYNCKYNLEILGPQDQPLLEVKDIRTRGNCLLPRASTLKTLTDKQKKLIGLAEGDAKMKGIKEVFIPEFCIHYDFPGVLWYKAIMLPSLIHRLTMLLVAEELRSTIARETNLGYESLPPGETW
ncbi:Endoribonuclease Dcr-1 [Eumeta japonica]|uniref:Endoribonuclease Dcr-1 n=1 Tax=Eumeta variegata TaxID=151549 RepID=A0A4C1WPT8_EUMVA|nr:Endoribonuclease Dcr-1 [Eumeta japonica]